MAPEKSHYDPAPPIPSYDEAIAGGSSWQQHDLPHSPIDGPIRTDHETEAQSLLNNSNNASNNARGRRPDGYQPPMVESEDEDGWGTDSDADEAEHVRREMQELEIEDPHDASSRSSWGKRIGFSLPQWRWKWRWRLPLPRLRTFRAQESQEPAAGIGGGTDTDNSAADTPPVRRFAFPALGSPALFLLVARIFVILLVVGVIWLLFMSDMFSSMARRMNSKMFDPESVRVHVQTSIDPRRIRDNLNHFTRYAHIAGTEGDYFMVEDTERMFRGYGLEDVAVDEYKVYLNYPKAGGRAVQLIGKDGKPTWSAKLHEDPLSGETAGQRTAAFHGHSKSGDVKGPLIFANYGSREDFQKLKDMGIGTKGAIALVKYYGTQSDAALKIKAAELAGFAGCLIYSDPGDDGFVKGEPAPKGHFMPADGVQRESVSLTSWVVGDVLTPGWGSKDNMPRMKVDESKGLVKIPSLPLAWRDAQVLLQHLKGVGKKAPDNWAGRVPDVKEWWTGDHTSPVVRLKNEQDENEKQPIWNVYGRIYGVEQSEKRIIIGNHRDSWTLGAADPHSGTAVMMEIVRVFGDLMSRGWRPLRTIEFMSWDAEEYNLIGSTEYVEQNDEVLKKDGMAYINLDTAVTGDVFHVAGSPVFKRIIYQILNRVGDPNHNTTLRDLFDRRHGGLESLGADSDYVAFQDIVGTSSIDLRFNGAGHPHHSAYDTFEWMDNVGDPGFVYHTLLGQVVALLILELADRPVVPFDLAAYADALPRWIDGLANWAKSQDAEKVSLAPLKEAAAEVSVSALHFHRWENKWENSIVAASGWEPIALGNTRCDYNTRMGLFETDLLDEAGIPNRTQFKHVLFGPQRWSDHDEAYFPSIRDVMASGDHELAAKTIQKVAGIIKKAAKNLVDGAA